jgi:hypothetical protein
MDFQSRSRPPAPTARAAAGGLSGASLLRRFISTGKEKYIKRLRLAQKQFAFFVVNLDVGGLVLREGCSKILSK